MRPIVIYHKNCADGFAAAWVFHRYFDAPIDFHPGVYGEDPPDVTDRTVFLVDFSYPVEVVEEMARTAGRVVLIDHHVTAINALKPLLDAGIIEGHISTEHSGAMLAWTYLHGEYKPPPVLLRHIEDRDLWRFAMQDTRAIQSAVFSYPYDFAVWDDLMSRDIESLVAEGKAIDRKHLKDINELLPETKHRRVIGGYNVPAANLPYIHASDAAHAMAKGEFFAACYFDTPTHRVFSLRSDGVVDVSQVAKQYGGGGHKNASGFRVPFGHVLAGPPMESFSE